MPLLTSEAIVLHTFDYLESSRIFRLATRGGGVHSALAKGARRSRRRFSSALDLFAQGTAQLSTKPGQDLDMLNGFDVTHARLGLADHLERFTGASVIAELALHFSAAHADAGLFDALAGALDAVSEADQTHARDATLAGAWRVIAALGFSPELARCIECETTLGEDESVVFSHAAGGTLCDGCASRMPGGRRLPASARAALLVWTAGREIDTLDDGAARAHQRLLREFLAHHVVDGRPLRAFAVWEHEQWGGA